MYYVNDNGFCLIFCARIAYAMCYLKPLGAPKDITNFKIANKCKVCTCVRVYIRFSYVLVKLTGIYTIQRLAIQPNYPQVLED